MKMMHNLIDKYEPRCLYCKGDVSFAHTGTRYLASLSSTHCETLTCLYCKEKFHIYSSQDETGETRYRGFSFTCEDYVVFNDYIESYFEISARKGNFMISLPRKPPASCWRMN